MGGMRLRSKGSPGWEASGYMCCWQIHRKAYQGERDWGGLFGFDSKRGFGWFTLEAWYG